MLSQRLISHLSLLLLVIPTTSGTMDNAQLVVVAKTAPGTEVSAPALDQHINEALARLAGVVDDTKLHPRTAGDPNVSRLSELEVLLVSAMRKAQQLNWSAAFAELAQVTSALSEDDGLSMGQERLLDARIWTARALLKAAHSCGKKKTTGSARPRAWCPEETAQQKAEEQIRAALTAMPELAISTDRHPPGLVKLFESVRKSMLATTQPSTLTFEVQTGDFELVIDGYRHVGKQSARVWPGRHNVRLIDLGLTASAPDTGNIPPGALGPEWALTVPADGLTLRLPSPHSQGLLLVSSAAEGNSLTALAAALNASQVLEVSVGATDGPAAYRLETLTPEHRILNEEQFAELFGQAEGSPPVEAEITATVEPGDVTRPTATAPLAEPETGPQVWPWLATGVAGASLLAGAILGGLALTDHDQLSGMERWDPGVNTVKARMDNEALAADVLFGIGAATGLAAVLLFVLDIEPTENTPVVVGPTGTNTLGATVRW